jgi:hypothetical protein
MKKKGIRVVLALILSIVMVVGTVSFVEAGKPIRTMSIQINGGGSNNITFSFGYNNYGAWGIEVTVKKYSIGTTNPAGPDYSEIFWNNPIQRLTSLIRTNVDIPHSGLSYDYQLIMALVKKNGTPQKRPGTVSSGVVTFPSP